MLENENTSSNNSESSKNDENMVVELSEKVMTDEIISKKHELNIKNKEELDK